MTLPPWGVSDCPEGRDISHLLCVKTHRTREALPLGAVGGSAHRMARVTLHTHLVASKVKRP